MDDHLPFLNSPLIFSAPLVKKNPFFLTQSPYAFKRADTEKPLIE